MRGGDIRQVFDPIMAETVDSLAFLQNPENNDQVLLFKDGPTRDGFAIERTRIRLANVGNDFRYNEQYNTLVNQYFTIPFAGNPITLRVQSDTSFANPNHRVFLFDNSGQRTERLFSEAVRRGQPGAGVSGLHGQLGSERDIYTVRALTVQQFQTLLNRRYGAPRPAAAPAAAAPAAAPAAPAAAGEYVKMTELSNNSQLSNEILDELAIGKTVKMYGSNGTLYRARVVSITNNDADDVLVNFSSGKGDFTAKIAREPRGRNIVYITQQYGIYLARS